MKLLEGRTDNGPSLAYRREHFRFGVRWYSAQRPLFFVSLGVHLDWRTPEFDLHLPFGILSIGRVRLTALSKESQP